MTFRALTTAALAALLFLGSLPAAKATANYQYKTGEYVTIKRGLSPNGAYAIQTHGEGELGDENFHLFLTNAKSGKRITLKEITDDSWFDTAAGAYHANWSADSQTVTISYRSDRHTISAVKYRIENGRAHRLSGPTPVSEREAGNLGWPDPNN